MAKKSWVDKAAVRGDWSDAVNAATQNAEPPARLPPKSKLPFYPLGHPTGTKSSKMDTYREDAGFPTRPTEQKFQSGHV
jgi:hypothetical protein